MYSNRVMIRLLARVISGLQMMWHLNRAADLAIAKLCAFAYPRFLPVCNRSMKLSGAAFAYVSNVRGLLSTTKICFTPCFRKSETKRSIAENGVLYRAIETAILNWPTRTTNIAPQSLTALR